MAQKINIYQVLPRLYGNSNTTNHPAGTLAQNGCGLMNDFTDAELQRIRAFGFTHIWYTGLLTHATCTDYSAAGIPRDHPAVVKGSAGSPYAVKDYYDIDPDLASSPEKRMREFAALLRRSHKAGLSVVMDFVPNHVARQYHSLAKPARTRDLGEDDRTDHFFHPDNNFYYIQGQTLRTDFTTLRTPEGPYREYPARATGNDRFDAYPTVNDWYETIKLNYGVDPSNGSQHFTPVPSTWKKMTDILLFWAKKGVDAFRCDMAEMVPCAFWEYAIARVKEKFPAVQFIAEVYNPAAYRDYIHRGGFDYLYDKVGLYDTLRAVVCGQASAACITGCWQATDDIREHMLYFLENHDEQRIASDFFATQPERALPALVTAACMGSNPFMVYAGQEVGERGMDAEGFSGCDGRTTIFDYWGVRGLQQLQAGEEHLPAPARALYDYYRRVITLTNESEALREGQFYDLMYANYDGAQGFRADTTYAFLRVSQGEALLVVSNYADAPTSCGVCIPQHAFSFLNLRPGLRRALDLLTGETQTLTLQPDGYALVTVPARGSVILRV